MLESCFTYKTPIYRPSMNFRILSLLVTSLPLRKNMAASDPSDAVQSLPSNIVIKKEPETEDCVLFGAEDVPVKREPVVPLMAPVSGLHPLVWSQDHRLAVCTTSSLSVMELVCDVNSNKQDLTFHRTSIPVPAEAHRLRVNIHICYVGSQVSL